MNLRNPFQNPAIGDEFATKSGTLYRIIGFLVSENKAGVRSRCVRADVQKEGASAVVEYLKLEVLNARLASSGMMHLSAELPVDWSQVPVVLHSEIGRSDHPVLS